MYLVTNSLYYYLAGVDYISDPVIPLVFTPGVSEQCAYITILEDSILEYDEHFSLHLNTSDDYVKFETKYAKVHIIDDDCK